MKLHLLRAAAGTACWYALCFAITRIPLDNATLLTYSAPLWMPLIAWLVSRQRVSAPTWLGVGLGFVGVTMVLQPQGRSVDAGELSAVAGALLLATAMLSVRCLGATEPMARVLFYYFLLSTVMAVVARAKIRAVILPGADRAVVSIRSGREGRPVHLLGHRVHRAHRLAGLESLADTGHVRGQGPVIGGTDRSPSEVHHDNRQLMW